MALLSDRQHSGRRLREFPLVGFAPQLMADPVGFLERLTAERGEAPEFKVANKSFVVLTTPTQFQECLVLKPKIYGFPDIYKNMATVIGEGITATPDGPVWRKKRLLLQPRFGPKTIQGFLQTFVETAKVTATKLGTMGGDVAIHEVSMDAALRNLFGCLFSRTFAESSAYGDFRDVSRIVGKRFWLPSKLLINQLTPSGRRLSRHVGMLDALVDGVVLDRLVVPAPNRPDDFLEFLLLAKDTETNSPLSAQQIRDELLNFIFAGYETTACLLSWSLMLLAKHPNIQELVRREALTLGELGGVQDFEKCRLIKAVLNESMRLYPPVGMMIRQSNQNDRIGDLSIKKGATVLLSPYLLHRRPADWRDAEEFRPERFFAEPGPPKHGFLPFGHGPRHCLGNHFALSEAVAHLFYLVRDLEFACEGELPKPEALITLQPPADFRLGVTLS